MAYAASTLDDLYARQDLCAISPGNLHCRVSRGRVPGGVSSLGFSSSFRLFDLPAEGALVPTGAAQALEDVMVSEFLACGLRTRFVAQSCSASNPVARRAGEGGRRSAGGIKVVWERGQSRAQFRVGIAPPPFSLHLLTCHPPGPLDGKKPTESQSRVGADGLCYAVPARISSLRDVTLYALFGITPCGSSSE